MCFFDISLFLFFQLSTLTTCNQYISLYFDVESLDTHDMRNKGVSQDIFSFAYNFLNNGPILINFISFESS